MIAIVKHLIYYSFHSLRNILEIIFKFNLKENIYNYTTKNSIIFLNIKKHSNRKIGLVKFLFQGS